MPFDRKLAVGGGGGLSTAKSKSRSRVPLSGLQISPLGARLRGQQVGRHSSFIRSAPGPDTRQERERCPAHAGRQVFDFDDLHLDLGSS